MPHPLYCFLGWRFSISTEHVNPQNQSNRIRVFIDYWNLQLTLNRREGEVTGENDPRFKIDWRGFSRWAASEAAEVVGLTNFVYEGSIIYVSYAPASTDAKFKRWLTSWLDRQPGIQVVAKERRPKGAPTCPACHTRMEYCPNCQTKVSATIEKGIDTALAMDMIRLAWEDAYDI